MAFNQSDNAAIVSTGLSGASRGQQSNEAMGELFKGLGQTLNNTLTAYDTATRTKIELQADEAVNATVDQNMPEGLQQGIGKLNDLATAKAQGAISETKFLTDVNLQAKRLRAQFPRGYGPIVERAVASAVGTSTANDLRRAAMSEQQAAAESGSAEVKALNSWMQQSEVIQYLNDPTVKAIFQQKTGGNTVENMVANPNPAQAGALKWAIAVRRGQDAEMDLAVKRIETTNKVNDFNANPIVDYAVSQAFNEVITPEYGELIRLQKMASDPNGLDKSQNWSGTESAQIGEAFSKFKIVAIKKIQDVLANSKVSAEARANFEQRLVKQIDAYGEMIYNKDIGKIYAVANANKGNMSSAVAALYGTSNVLSQIAVAKEIGFPDQMVTNMYPATVQDAQVAFDNPVAMAILSGKATFSEAIDAGDKHGENMPAAVSGVMKTLSSALNAPVNKPEDVAAVAVNLFSEKNADLLKRIAEQDRIGAFEMLMTPVVIKKLQESNNPEALKAAMNWGTKQFEIITKTARDEVVSTDANRIFKDVVFENDQFSVKNRTPTVGEQVTNLSPMPWETYATSKAGKAVSDINRYINVMKPVWASQGITPAEALSGMMMPDVNNMPKNPTVLQSLGKALYGFVAGTPAEAAVPQPGEKPAVSSTGAKESQSSRESAQATRVVAAGKGWTTIEGPDGKQILREGSRNWRNNNPGNIEYGSFAKSHGAVGTDGRFAVFPSYEAGRKAKEALLFESKGYAGKTIAEAIARYAPSFENDTGSYTAAVAKAAGVSSDTPLADLSPDQRIRMLDAMEKVEGFKPGKETQLALADE